MAIIAQLITLWRLQTYVIYIFPSSHLACCLENASVQGVNLAITQPSLQPPFSKPFLSWSSVGSPDVTGNASLSRTL